MRTNSFKCTKCGEFTRHIEITYREADAINTASWNSGKHKVYSKAEVALGKISGSFFDLIGAPFIGTNIFDRTPYKCCKCGKCTWRNSEGKVIKYIGESR